MTLDGECDLLVRCLIGRPPAAEVLSSYRKAHDLGVVDVSHATALDRALLRVASFGPAFARIADSLAALAAPGGLLRKKMVLLTAILESRGDSSHLIDTAVSGSQTGWFLSVALAAVGSALRAAAALVVVLPCWIWYRLR